jgi:hypothetical protein
VGLLRNLEDSLSSLSELIGLDLCKSLAEDDAMPVILWSSTVAEKVASNEFKPFQAILLLLACYGM